MYYVGFDQSSSNTGIATLIGDVVYSTNLKLKTSDDLLKKLQVTRNYLRDCFTAPTPDIVITEDIYTPANRIKAFKALIRVETTIHNFFYDFDVPLMTITPNPRLGNSWPRMLQITSTKDPMREWLEARNRQESVTLYSEHECDSIGVLLGGLIQSGKISLVNAKELRFVRSIANKYPSLIRPELENLNSQPAIYT